MCSWQLRSTAREDTRPTPNILVGIARGTLITVPSHPLQGTSDTSCAYRPPSEVLTWVSTYVPQLASPQFQVIVWLLSIALQPGGYGFCARALFPIRLKRQNTPAAATVQPKVTKLKSPFPIRDHPLESLMACPHELLFVDCSDQFVPTNRLAKTICPQIRIRV